MAETVAASFVEDLETSLDDPLPALRMWREALVHRPGDTVTVRTSSGADHSGRFVGVTDGGFLRLETEGGEVVVSSGDVVE